MSNDEDLDVDVAVEVELEPDPDSSEELASGRRGLDQTSGRHTKQKVYLWRGEEAVEQASNALGFQIAVISSQVSRHLGAVPAGEYGVESAELEFGVKLKAGASKVFGVFSLDGERTVKVKLTMKRAPKAE